MQSSYVSRSSTDSTSRENRALLSDDIDLCYEEELAADEHEPPKANSRRRSQSNDSMSTPETHKETFHRPLLGKVRAYWLGTIICMGGFLFGYDSGIVGGVLQLPSFQDDFHFSTSSHKQTQSLAVSLQQLGAFIACFAIWPFTSRFGRKRSLIFCSLVFSVGAVIETINDGSRTAFYIGRIIAGLGLGGATVVTPMYSAEMTPKELRGQIGCFFQLMFTIGIFTSYWTNYGVKTGLPVTSQQWQIPIGLQLVPAGILGLGVLTLKESVRWYEMKGMHDKAWDSLRWIRASDGPEVRQELEEIRVGVKREARAKEGFEFKELLERHNLSRLFTAFWIFTAQQSTGATALAYYAPQYFQALVGPGDRNLLISGIFGAVKVIACGTFVFLLSERYGRRTAFIVGALLMAVFQLITAAINRTYPPSEHGNGSVTASGKATVAFIYLFVLSFNISWGPLPWPYVSEIFPARTREIGIGVGVAAQWLFNFIYTLSTPYMIESLGWATFLLWGIFNIVIAILSYLFIKETQGMSLEQINASYSRNGHIQKDDHLSEHYSVQVYESNLRSRNTSSPQTGL